MYVCMYVYSLYLYAQTKTFPISPVILNGNSTAFMHKILLLVYTCTNVGMYTTAASGTPLGMTYKYVTCKKIEFYALCTWALV